MGKIEHPCNRHPKIQKDSKAPPSQEMLLNSTPPESTFSQYHQIPIQLGSHLSSKDEEKFWFKNMAVNSSLSYTLKHFISKVTIQPSKNKDFWSPFKKDPFEKIKLYHSSQKIFVDKELSKEEEKKFLDFFKFLKRFFLIPGHYEISSQNNFPKSAGLASSASSFSALSLAAYKLAQSKSQLPKEKWKLIKALELAHLSRVGSGSSCRSFFKPWCIWDQYKVYPFDCAWNQMDHQLILINNKKKLVSSSLAHHKVKTSPWFKQRVRKVTERITAIKTAFNLEDWKECCEISRKEFLEVHKIFESSQPPFSYQTAESQKVLDLIREVWSQCNEGPLVTMDAGPNIHLLYRKDQTEIKNILSKKLSDYPILSSL